MSGVPICSTTTPSDPRRPGIRRSIASQIGSARDSCAETYSGGCYGILIVCCCACACLERLVLLIIFGVDSLKLLPNLVRLVTYMDERCPISAQEIGP